MKRFLALCAALACAASLAPAADKKIVLIAGKPSHPPGMHEFRAGCLLLQQSLAGMRGVRVEVHDNGWPASDSVLEDAAAVVELREAGQLSQAHAGGDIGEVELPADDIDLHAVEARTHDALQAVLLRELRLRLRVQHQGAALDGGDVLVRNEVPAKEGG